MRPRTQNLHSVKPKISTEYAMHNRKGEEITSRIDICQAYDDEIARTLAKTISYAAHLLSAVGKSKFKNEADAIDGWARYIYSQTRSIRDAKTIESNPTV